MEKAQPQHHHHHHQEQQQQDQDQEQQDQDHHHHLDGSSSSSSERFQRHDDDEDQEAPTLQQELQVSDKKDEELPAAAISLFTSFDDDDGGECSGRERLQRHGKEVAGQVWIPDIWGQEELLKDWIDCSAFDACLVPSGVISARAALVHQASRTTSNSPLRIENRSSKLITLHQKLGKKHSGRYRIPAWEANISRLSFIMYLVKISVQRQQILSVC